MFFHVYLSFPTGRLPGAPERWVVGAGYFVAVGLQLVGLALGGFRPDNVLAVLDEQDLWLTLFDVQLVALAALALRERRGAGLSPPPRPGRRCGARRRCSWTPSLWPSR